MDNLPDSDTSISRKKWTLRNANEDHIRDIAHSFNIPHILARLIVARGITPQDDITAFLNPKLKNLMPNPSILKDMDIASQRLAHAIRTNEPIGIIADYDVDGITSASLLNQYLNHYNTIPLTLFPNRKKHGYGPNQTLFQQCQQNNISLVITLDCGSNSIEPLNYAKNAGIDVIVIDHHMINHANIPALACVNPKQPDDTSQLETLAAVGVTFLFIAATHKIIRSEPHISKTPQPQIIQWIDLVALGTLCDLVPLNGLNRAFVRQGLKVMAKRINPGITKLLDGANIKKPPDAKTITFIIGPKINAAGRIDNPNIALNLLTTKDNTKAHIYAEKLEAINQKRKHIENNVMIQAEEQYSKNNQKTHAIILEGEWESGVIGIIAGRLKEQKNKPVIIVGETNPQTQTRTASGRSIEGINLGDIIEKASKSNIIEKGGGHHMAVGFTIKDNNIKKLKDFMQREIQNIRQNTDQIPTPKLHIDGVISAAGVTRNFLDIIAQAGEFGNGNPEPIFLFPNHTIEWVQQIGQTPHLKCKIKGEGKSIEAMAPRALDGSLGNNLMQLNQDRAVHIAATPVLNQWNGRQIPQLIIRDVALA